MFKDDSLEDGLDQDLTIEDATNADLKLSVHHIRLQYNVIKEDLTDSEEHTDSTHPIKDPTQLIFNGCDCDPNIQPIIPGS